MIPHFRYRISSFDNQKIRADNSSSQDNLQVKQLTDL